MKKNELKECRGLVKVVCLNRIELVDKFRGRFMVWEYEFADGKYYGIIDLKDGKRVGQNRGNYLYHKTLEDVENAKESNKGLEGRGVDLRAKDRLGRDRIGLERMRKERNGFNQKTERKRLSVKVEKGATVVGETRCWETLFPKPMNHLPPRKTFQKTNQNIFKELLHNYNVI